MAILLFISTPLGPWLVARVGTGGFVVTCIGAMALGDGIVCLGLAAPAPWPTIALVAGLSLIGLGGGAANGSMDNLAMGTIDAARAGMAAGLFQTVRIGSAALAVAVAGSVIAIGHGGEPQTAVDSQIAARYAALAGVAAIVMAILAALCIVVLKTARGSART